MKTIIFDFDGTIADTLPTILKLFNRHAKEFGFEKLSVQEVRSLQDLTPFQILRKYGIRLVKLPLLANKVRAELNLEMDGIPIFSGMKEAVLSLYEKGFRLGILTSNSRENVLTFLKQNRIDVFDFIHSEQNLLAKGSALKRLLQKYKISKQEAAYVGDEIRDIDASKRNGVKIISVTWGFNHRNVLFDNRPDALAKTPRDIPKAVENLFIKSFFAVRNQK